MSFPIEIPRDELETVLKEWELSGFQYAYSGEEEDMLTVGNCDEDAWSWWIDYQLVGSMWLRDPLEKDMWGEDPWNVG